MSNPFRKNAFYKRRVVRAVCSNNVEPQEYLAGCMSLSDQVRCFRAGGLPPSVRTLTDALYDEDDSTVVDPMSDFGSDRFERSERVAEMISDRMKKSKKKKLDEAKA